MKKFNYQKYNHADWHASAGPLKNRSEPILHDAQTDDEEQLRATIKVLGIGGGGGNAVNSMIDGNLEGVSFVIANTDAQALKLSPAQKKLQIGTKITKGLGAGSNPDIGRRAAEEDLETIVEHIKDTDILFLTAGLGGGTGTGAISVIADVAREMGILTVAVVTKPFMFEGKRRARQAEEAITLLHNVVDTLIVVPNQKLIELADPKISMLDAFGMANNVLKQAIKGVADIIVRPGHMNVDFADVHSIMKGMGMAIMGTGRCDGEDRAVQAAKNAINSPLVEDVRIEGAKGVLINITGNAGLGLHEISQAAQIIYEKASGDANIILGSVIDPNMGDEVMVTVIATGFEHEDAAAITSVKNIVPIMSKPVVHTPAREDAPVSEQVNLEDDAASSALFSSAPTETEASSVTTLTKTESVNINDLDTPTFLRERAKRRTEQENN